MILKCSYSSSLKDGHYKISGYDDANDDSNEVNNKKEKSYHLFRPNYNPATCQTISTCYLKQVLTIPY